MSEHAYVRGRARLADDALQTIEAARSYAEPVSKYEAAKGEVVRLKQEVEQAKQTYDMRKAQEERDEIAKRIDTRRELLEQQKREKIQQLFKLGGPVAARAAVWGGSRGPAADPAAGPGECEGPLPARGGRGLRVVRGAAANGMRTCIISSAGRC